MLQLSIFTKIKEIDVAYNIFMNADRRDVIEVVHTCELINYICILLILIIITRTIILIYVCIRLNMFQNLF